MANQPAPPSDPYAPYAPSDAEPWNIKRIGHLLRRVNFGATDDWIDTMYHFGPAEAINTAIDYDPAVDPLNDMLDQLEGYLVFTEPKSVQGWWVYRMLYNTHPMQEKIALFWHNHFATSFGKVNNVKWMHIQIEMFRHLGLGNFRDLLLAVTKDPAMLVWLDGGTNIKGKPNENYAREVMELFTLGIGTYTEKDVKELARAFTGWRIQNDAGVFAGGNFDDGEKEIFGKKGSFNSEGAIDLLLAHPAASKHLSRILLREFVHPDPTQEMIDHYATRAVELKWEIKPLLKEMLSSRLFFSDWAYRSRIKSPIELAVGAVAALGGKVNTGWVRDNAAKMGQELLYPPNVKGWDGGEAWINANTVLLRFNFGLALATQRQQEFAKPSDIEGFIKRHKIKTPEDIVDKYGKLFLDGEIDDDTRAKFVHYVKFDGKGEVPKFDLNPGIINAKVRGLIHLMMSTPEFQLA